MTSPMSGAEMKALREDVGVTTAWLSKYFDVDMRTVQRWEDGDRIIPHNRAVQLDELQRDTDDAVASLARYITTYAPGVVLTYRTDDWINNPLAQQHTDPLNLSGTRRPWSSQWHRRVVRRAVVAAGTPRIRIDYADTAWRLERPGTNPDGYSTLVAALDFAALLPDRPEALPTTLAATFGDMRSYDLAALPAFIEPTLNDLGGSELHQAAASVEPKQPRWTPARLHESTTRNPLRPGQLSDLPPVYIRALGDYLGWAKDNRV